MSSTVAKSASRGPKTRPTLTSLHKELTRLRQRVEDLEDLRELNQAIERNGTKPLSSWAEAKKQLGLG